MKNTEKWYFLEITHNKYVHFKNYPASHISQFYTIHVPNCVTDCFHEHAPTVCEPLINYSTALAHYNILKLFGMYFIVLTL